MLVLNNMLSSTDKSSCHYGRLLYALTEAVDMLQVNPDNVDGARARLSGVKRNNDPDMNAYSIGMTRDCSRSSLGHAHIDTSWLWPMDETVRKVARTFSNQLDLMVKYPDYMFGASVPQHYWFMKVHYPQIYEQVKAAVKRGQWELQGGLWIENDGEGTYTMYNM